MNIGKPLKSAVIFFLVVLFINCSQKKENEIVSDQNPIKLENSKINNYTEKTKDSVDIAITHDFFNFYVNNIKINFCLDNITKLDQIFGPNIESNVFSRDKNGEIDLMQNNYEGITVLFAYQTGKLFNVIISLKEYPVERNGCIGKTKAEIKDIYPEGFFQEKAGDEKLDCFYVMVLNASKTHGTGFRFYFNEKERVEFIIISDWSFAR